MILQTPQIAQGSQIDLDGEKVYPRQASPALAFFFLVAMIPIANLPCGRFDERR
jgi:hypothetical protein